MSSVRSSSRSAVPRKLTHTLIAAPILAFLALWADSAIAESQAMAILADDRPLQKAVELPEWIEPAPFDLSARLDQARSTGKKGLLLYVGQSDCPYCKAHLERNWGRPKLAEQTRANFDVLAIDVQGQQPLIDFEGRQLTESVLAQTLNVVLTPSFVFIDQTGKPALRLEGYHDHARFRKALDYVAKGHYRKHSFREYVRRGSDLQLAAFEASTTLDQVGKLALDAQLLDRSEVPAKKPLLVFFEGAECGDCERLADGPLEDGKIARMIERVETAHIDMESAAPVLTPDGRLLTARAWAKRLGLFHAPTLMFFDVHGREILRVESPVSYYRLNDVLEYVLSDAYPSANFQVWRREHGR